MDFLKDIKVKMSPVQKELSNMVAEGLVFYDSSGSRRKFAANAVRLQLHAPRLPAHAGDARAGLKVKLVKIGAKVVSHGCYVVFQMAEVAIPRQMFHGRRR